MAGKADTGIKVIPVKNNLGRSLLVMTCYVLILPPGGTVCSVKHYELVRVYFYAADGKR